MAKSFVDNVNPVKPDKKYVVIKPLQDFSGDEKPESVLFFVNPDQLSALCFLMHYDAPESFDRIIAPFASSCMATITYPLKMAKNNEEHAIIGNFDIAARTRMPADLLSFALPYRFLERMAAYIPESFFTTHNWETIKERI
jgi:hypothetical protein